MAGRTISTNKALRKIVEAATSTLELEDLLKSILTTLKEVIGSDSASILLQHNGKIKLRAAIGITIDDEARTGYELNPGEGLAGIIFSTREPLFVEDITSDPKVINPFLKASGIRSYLGVPIISRSETIGVLNIDWKSIHKYTPRELGLLTIVADRCGAAIANANQHAELKEAEERLRVITETSPVQIAVSRVSDSVILFTNPAYDRAFGYEKGELIGYSAPELYVYPKDRIEILDDLKKKDYSKVHEVRVKKKDGTQFWVEVSLAPIRFNGEDAFIGASIDITERKRKEVMLQVHQQLLETIVNFMPVGVCLIRGTDLRLQLVNPNYQAIGPGKDMVGKTLNEIWPETGRDFSEICQQVLATGEPHHMDDELYTIRRRPDGPLEQAYFSWSLFRVLLPGDEGWGLLNMAWETTEHKKVENTIKEERDRLVSLINSIEDEIWFSNKDGVFTLKNPSAQRGFELDTKVKGVKELAGTIEVFRPDGTPRPVDEAPPLLALKGHSVRNQEEIVRLPASGELRHRQVTASPVRDADGNIIGSVSVVRDISEVKRAEMQLLETRNFLENLIDYANAPIIVWDPNFRITRFNHAFEHLTGYSAIDVLGRQLDLLFPANYKEPSIALIRRTGTGEHWESVEIPILCADGQVRTVLWNSATIFHPETNKVIATIAQGQDITDRKKAEMALAEASSYLENLIDYANAPIIVWDPDFKIIRFNRAFEHLTGMKASDVLGKDLDILFPAVSRQDTMEKIHWTSKGEHWESVETPVQRFDGSTRLVLWNSATIFSPGTDRIFATIAQGQDITARKDAERELVRSNAELEQFAYVASHDLKEPLRMISGFLELLQLRYKGKIDAEADEFIRFAIDGANRMNWLIEDLLQFSRIGRASWKLEQTSMQDAYQQAVDNLRAHIREANAEITRGELPTLFVDRLQMTTLLQNLIGNAIKFRSQARPEVEVLAKRESGGWVFSVKDNGIGFPMEYSEKIFELFERLHSKEKYPGTGIGLAICKKIVERHGGRIWAESKEGEGSTFYFFIPDKVGVTNVL